PCRADRTWACRCPLQAGPGPAQQRAVRGQGQPKQQQDAKRALALSTCPMLRQNATCGGCRLENREAELFRFILENRPYSEKSGHVSATAHEPRMTRHATPFRKRSNSTTQRSLPNGHSANAG